MRGYFFLATVITLSSAVALTACSQPEKLPPARSATAQQQPERAPPAPRQSRGAESRLPHPQPRPPVEGAPPSTPKLLGLSEEETAALLGQPVEEASEPPAKVWLYRTADCQLSVHLFPDLESGGFTALDYSASDSPREACLGKVAALARRRTG